MCLWNRRSLQLRERLPAQDKIWRNWHGLPKSGTNDCLSQYHIPVAFPVRVLKQFNSRSLGVCWLFCSGYFVTMWYLVSLKFIPYWLNNAKELCSFGRKLVFAVSPSLKATERLLTFEGVKLFQEDVQNFRICWTCLFWIILVYPQLILSLSEHGANRTSEHVHPVGMSLFKPSGARLVWSSFNEGSDKGKDERALMRLIPWLEPALGLLLLVTLATDPLSATHGMCMLRSTVALRHISR